MEWISFDFLFTVVLFYDFFRFSSRWHRKLVELHLFFWLFPEDNRLFCIDCNNRLIVYYLIFFPSKKRQFLLCQSFSILIFSFWFRVSNHHQSDKLKWWTNYFDMFCVKQIELEFNLIEFIFIFFSHTINLPPNKNFVFKRFLFSVCVCVLYTTECKKSFLFLSAILD